MSDIQTVVNRQCLAGQSGVIVAVSVDVKYERLKQPKSNPDGEDDDWPEEPLDQFRRLVGDANIPASIESIHLRGSELAETYRKVVTDKILSTIAAFPGWNYKQTMNFRYADGAPMATYGGVIYRDEDGEKFQQAKFEALTFAKAASEPYEIETPRLTFREIHSLGPLIHNAECPQSVPVENSEFQKFKEIYRYFPAFVEAEL